MKQGIINTFVDKSLMYGANSCNACCSPDRSRLENGAATGVSNNQFSPLKCSSEHETVTALLFFFPPKKMLFIWSTV